MSILHLAACHSPARFFRKPPQFIELKQLADLEQRMRVHCRAAIRTHRNARWHAQCTDDPIDKHYKVIEMVMLRRQARDAVRIYLMMRRDARQTFKNYIASIVNAKF